MNKTGLRLAMGVEAFFFSALFAVFIYAMGTGGFDCWKMVVTIISAIEAIASFGFLIVGETHDCCE